ncbi:MAG: hypothetical protein AAF525_14760, partial [Pseudomonadota bacterium]
RCMKSLVKTIVITAIAAVTLTTVIGYIDEGHPRIYGSFANYLMHQAWPPFNDHVLWLLIFEGIAVYSWWLLRPAWNNEHGKT